MWGLLNENHHGRGGMGRKWKKLQDRGDLLKSKVVSFRLKNKVVSSTNAIQGDKGVRYCRGPSQRID